MVKIKPTFSLTILLLSILLAVCVHAEDNTCLIMAGPQDDVWVIIYDADADGNRGPIIWKGKIEARQSVPITSTDGHIRFDFKKDRDQPYEGDLSRGCYDQKTILVD